MKSKTRGTAAARSLSALLAIAALTACTSTTTTRTVSSPITEQRARVAANAPLATSTWMLSGTTITGHVTWASCLSQRAWTIEQQRSVHRRPIPLAGWGLLAGGGALVGVGLGTRDNSAPEPACPTDTIDYNLQMLYGSSCGHRPNNDASNTELIVGAVAMAAGLVVLSIGPSDQTQTLRSEPHLETATGPCIAAADLSTLILVLKLGERQFVRVALEPNGDARIELPANLPASARPKPGAELPIVVYRPPPAAAALLPRWQVIGTVHVPE
jgi:hypothetical protein